MLFQQFRHFPGAKTAQTASLEHAIAHIELTIDFADADAHDSFPSGVDRSRTAAVAAVISVLIVRREISSPGKMLRITRVDRLQMDLLRIFDRQPANLIGEALVLAVEFAASRR